jgi:predicted alpha/beta hydrolase family esterase
VITAFLDFRASPRGGGLGPTQLYDTTGVSVPRWAWSKLGAPGGHVVFLVHGFNNSRAEGQAALLDFAGRLTQSGLSVDALVAVLWPGDAALPRWIRPGVYPLEERKADDTAARLAKLVTNDLKACTRADFVAHSLGCRVSLQSMMELAPERLAPASAVLMAAAVDRDSLARTDRYRSAAQRATRVATLSSREDKTLKLAYPMGDAVAALIWGGYPSIALGHAGPRPSNDPAPVFACQIPDARKIDHGDYLNNSTAAQFAYEALIGVPVPSYP